MSRTPLLLLLLLCSCASQGVMEGQASLAAQPAVPLCELLAHPRQFVGSRISVEGLYGYTPHERILHDPSCKSYLAIQLAGDDGSVRMDRRLERLSKRNRNGVKAVYRGLVGADSVIAGCSEDYCFRYKMTEARLARYGDAAGQHRQGHP